MAKYSAVFKCAAALARGERIQVGLAVVEGRTVMVHSHVGWRTVEMDTFFDAATVMVRAVGRKRLTAKLKRRRAVTWL